MSKLNNFTSTGTKLFNHLDRLSCLQDGIVKPIVAHIMPTSICNLNCPYCSIKSRPLEELKLEDIKQAVTKLKDNGLKAIILSGGGEPTLYKHFDKLINFLDDLDLEIGLITNGTMLTKINLDKITWVRVSINQETIDNLELPVMKNVLGFSYIVSGESKETLTKNIDKINILVNKYSPKYVRVLSDCAKSNEEIIKTQELIKSVLVNYSNKVFFQQFKLPESPENCYLGYLHPVLYCDGHVYPCDSIVLNDHQEQKFKDKYRICDMKDLTPLLKPKSIKSLVCSKEDCPNCVFKKQNDLLDSIINPTEVHKNFI